MHIEQIPLITDPFFYAVSIPAVLLLGISKSGFGSGFGSLAVPMMAMAVTVPQAAAILMPVLLVMDLLGISAYRRDFDKKLLKFLLPWALVGTVIGTLLFKVLDSSRISTKTRLCPSSKMVGSDFDGNRRFYQFHSACRWTAHQRLFDSFET
jgi:RsiW-degrading membrane proteinase PrsW (M82 family)